MLNQQARVLIMGDEPVILLLEQLMLDEEGYTVTINASAAAASRILGETNPSLLMLDAGLPGREIRHISLTPNIIVNNRLRSQEQRSSQETAVQVVADPLVSGVGEVPVEMALLAGELHVDFIKRRVTLGAQLVSLPDILTQTPYSPDYGSGMYGPQCGISSGRRGEQFLGGALVLHLDLRQLGRWVEGRLVRARRLVGDTAVDLSSPAIRHWNVVLQPRFSAQGASLRRLLKQARTRRFPWSKASAATAVETTEARGVPAREPETDQPKDAQPPRTGSDQRPATPQEKAVVSAARSHRSAASRLEPFLSALLEAYSKVASRNGDDPLLLAPVVPLVDVYESLRWSPGYSGSYSKEQFARDIYLLHRSGLDTTPCGAQVSFPISRGVPEKTFTTTDERGEEKRYYGIRFMRTSRARADRTSAATPQMAPV